MSQLPYGRHEVTDDDVAAVTEALRSDWLTTGPMVDRFERALEQLVGAEHVIAVSSGTAALHAAYAAAGVGAGDEVIVPPLTFVATANAALYCGARPVFADIDAATLMLDPRAAAAAIGPRTRAIVAVDFAGAPAPLADLRALAGHHGLALIEDAAHALGASRAGVPVGTGADLTTFSFHPVKLLTTAEGGAISTGSAERAQTMRTFRNHGIGTLVRDREREGTWQYDMTDLGYNYRLPDVGAALGLSQLGRYAAALARRRALARRYLGAIGAIEGVTIPAADPDEHAWHFFPVLIRPDVLSATRDEILRALRAEGIGANVHYRPVHLQGLYRKRFGFVGGEFPIAEDAAAREITLPLFPGMSDADQDDVSVALDRVLRWFSV